MAGSIIKQNLFSAEWKMATEDCYNLYESTMDGMGNNSCLRRNNMAYVRNFKKRNGANGRPQQCAVYSYCCLKEQAIVHMSNLQIILLIIYTIQFPNEILYLHELLLGAALTLLSHVLALVPAKERKRSQDEIANDLQRKLARFNDARIFATQDQTISVGGSRGGLPVQFILQNQDLNKLRDIIPKFLDEAKKDKTFSNVDVNLKFNRPELQLTVDRMKIKDLGLSTQDVVATMQAAFSGGRLAYFIQNGFQYSVIAQVERTDRNKPVRHRKIVCS